TSALALPVFAFSPDLNRVAMKSGVDASSSGHAAAMKLVDMASGTELWNSAQALDGQPVGLAFSSDGRRLAAASSLGYVSIRDAARGQGARAPWGMVDPIMSVAWSPDNRWLATAGTMSVRLWDVEAGEPVREIDLRIESMERMIATFQGLRDQLKKGSE